MSMKWLKGWMGACVMAMGLVACGGGGGDPGAPPFGTDNGSGSGGGSTGVTELQMTAATAQIPNGGAGTTTVTITALNAARNTVPDAPISVSADQGAVVTLAGSKTDTSGQTVATVSIGSDKSNRTITLTAKSGSTETALQLQVIGTKVSSVLAPAVVNPSATGTVKYRVVDQASNPMAGRQITVSAPGATPDSATGTTDANGEYTYSYTAPATAGPLQISAMSGGAGDVTTVTIQQANSLDPVDPNIPISASVSANPSVVAINTAGSQSNRSEIRALFVGNNNQPIKNVRVRFDLADDVNNIGGEFTTNQTLYSDANGVVTTAYVPGTRASPTDGVTVRVCYERADDAQALEACTHSATTKLTVTNEPLGVSIGTNELVIVNTLTYVKQFVVSVVDSAGVAKSDVNLSVSVDLPTYHKGHFIPGGGWTRIRSISCPNEDTNRNGVREPSLGEDQDGDQRLDPGKSDVSVTLLSPKTAADGTAILQVQYAKSFGTWVDALITVSASGVSGSVGRATYVLAPVPVPAAAVSCDALQLSNVGSQSVPTTSFVPVMKFQPQISSTN
jgi:hypothetical protein